MNNKSVNTSLTFDHNSNPILKKIKKIFKWMDDFVDIIKDNLFQKIKNVNIFNQCNKKDYLHKLSTLYYI